MSKTCVVCHKRAYSDYCMQHKPRKPIPKEGKKANKWKHDRKIFIKNNPPDHRGYWHCVVGGVALDKWHLSVDHDTPRSKGGKNTEDNLNPMCGFHNTDKGSRTLEEYLPTGSKKPCNAFLILTN